MRIICRVMMVALGFLSCSADRAEERLIGNWSYLGFQSEFEFYQDSLIFNEWGVKYINEWSVQGSDLYLNPLKGMENKALKRQKLEFRLSKNNDTLFIKKRGDSSFGPALTRIKDAFDYQLKRNNQSINLPIDKYLDKEPTSSLGLDIYVGYDNENRKINVKRIDGKIINLSNIKFITYNELALSGKNMQSKVHYNLIADKSIQKPQLDSIRDYLTEADIGDIFRVYTNSNVDYHKLCWKDSIVWFGKME